MYKYVLGQPQSRYILGAPPQLFLGVLAVLGVELRGHWLEFFFFWSFFIVRPPSSARGLLVPTWQAIWPENSALPQVQPTVRPTRLLPKGMTEAGTKEKAHVVNDRLACIGRLLFQLFVQQHCCLVGSRHLELPGRSEQSQSWRGGPQWS